MEVWMSPVSGMKAARPALLRTASEKQKKRHHLFLAK